MIVWSSTNKGRVESRLSHGVLHTDVNNPSTVLKTICFPDNKELRVPAILWGKDHEKDALKDYEQKMKSLVPHVNCCIQKAGLLIDIDLPFKGASADAVTSCDCHGKRVVEVKCPYSFKDRTLQEFVNAPVLH